MAGPADQFVQHLVPDDHFVHDPVSGKENVMVLAPMTGTLAAGTGEAGAFDDRPGEAVEVTGETRARLRFVPPLLVHRRWSQWYVPDWIEAAATQRCHQRRGAEDSYRQPVPVHPASATDACGVFSGIGWTGAEL